MLHCSYLYTPLLSWSNVSKQSSDIGDEVGVGSIIEVDTAIDVEVTVVINGLSEDCNTEVVKDELDVGVVKGVDELITTVVVCTVEVVDVVVEDVVMEELCSKDELGTLDEVVGCTTEEVEKPIEVVVKLVVEEVSCVDALPTLVELAVDENAVVVIIVGVGLVDVVITVADNEIEGCTGQLLLAE